MNAKTIGSHAGAVAGGAMLAVASIGLGGDLKLDPSKPEQAKLVCYSYTPAHGEAPASWAMSVEGCPVDSIHPNAPGCKRIDASLVLSDATAAACVRYGAERWNAGGK